MTDPQVQRAAGQGDQPDPAAGCGDPAGDDGPDHRPAAGGVEGDAVGFGSYHYKYPSGREGDASAVGFAAAQGRHDRVPDGRRRCAHRVSSRGSGRTPPESAACISRTCRKVDLQVLEEIVRTTYAKLTAGVYGQRAREGSEQREADEAG